MTRRHAKYKHQYRAMFVHNVKVRWDQVLRVPSEPREGATAAATAAVAAAAAAASSVGARADDVYRPVQCAVCETELAVYDRDEVFHFFNVIADTPL